MQLRKAEGNGREPATYNGARKQLASNDPASHPASRQHRHTGLQRRRLSRRVHGERVHPRLSQHRGGRR